MIRVEPTINNIKFSSLKEKQDNVVESKKQENNKNMLVASLIGLAAVGATAVGIKKSSPISYERALEKAGIEIKNGIAVLSKTGEKYTGKIQRFESRTKKETIQFVDGVITEKLQHNLLGKELEGVFYQEGKPIFKIWKSVGQEKNSRGFAYTYEGAEPTKPNLFVKTKEGFDWARKFIEKNVIKK